jgi:ABC-2 type transport system permease protein
MPEAMRQVAEWSPMSWGLEGFLDVMLRGGGFAAIAPALAGLTTLGVVAILMAGVLNQRRID